LAPSIPISQYLPQISEGPYHKAITEGTPKGKSAERKRKWDEWEEEMLDDEELAAKQARREAKKAKKTEKKSSISKEKRKAMKQEALQSVQTPLIAG
jgi:ribosome biogenesis protein UTP30